MAKGQFQSVRPKPHDGWEPDQDEVCYEEQSGADIKGVKSSARGVP